MKARILLLPAFIFLLASALELPKSIAQHGVAARESARDGSVVRYAFSAVPVHPRTAAVVVEKPGDAVLDLLDAQPDLLPQHKRIAAEVLRMLPLSCLPKLQNFYVRRVTAPSASASTAYTIQINGSATGAPTCTISAGATTCQDTATTLAVSAGSLIAIKAVNNATTTTATNAWASVQLQ